MVGIYTPTLGRPDSLQRFVDNIAAVTRAAYEVVFVLEPDDPSIRPARRTGATVLVNQYEPSYSNALQTAFDTCDHDLFLYANDDFEFTPGWDKAIALLGNSPEVQVVGINDGGPFGPECKTIAAVRRSYILDPGGVIDMPPGRVLYPYQHNYVDTEFYETAKHRGVFRACPGSVIRHAHPDWGYATDDATYRKGRAALDADAAVYHARKHLWGG